MRCRTVTRQLFCTTTTYIVKYRGSLGPQANTTEERGLCKIEVRYGWTTFQLPRFQASDSCYAEAVSLVPRYTVLLTILHQPVTPMLILQAASLGRISNSYIEPL